MAKHLLYTFRRCPYAMRARMALRYANISYEPYEVDFKNKPDGLLSISPKGTVPVLKLGADRVLEESLDIMYWALAQQDPDHWLAQNTKEKEAFDPFIMQNDQEFKANLDRYKYPERYLEKNAKTNLDQAYFLKKALVFLEKVEASLSENKFLFRETLSVADVAIFPFVRQFYKVDNQVFSKFGLEHTEQWLHKIMHTSLFKQVMEK